MTIRTQEEIYTSLRDGLTGKISSLTNFTTNSFNYVWTQAFAEELREREIQLTVAQLSGWIDYSGGPVNDDDLADLGLDEDVTIEELDEYITDDHLDELVKLVGIERDQGAEASGTVTFTTQSAATTIPAGTEVGTQPDSTGEFFRYETIEQVETGSGVTTVDAGVEAIDVGAEYNTGSGSVTYLPNPPGGVQRVTNADAIDGGEDIESNEDLRQRAKEAVFRSSGGGTVQGIIGYIEENTGATEVTIIEFPSGDSIRNYPHGHVVVSGGTDAEVLQAIEESRPASVEHVLRRPAIISLNIAFTLDGEDIDTDEIQQRVEDYLDDLSLDEDLFEDKIIFTVMGADDDIDNIVSIDYSVNDEAFFYDSNQDVYTMQLDTEMLDDGISSVEGTLNGTSHTFVEDTDYQEWNSSAGDTSTPHDSIDWSVGISSNLQNFSYSAGQTEYSIDTDMVYEGITQVDNQTTATTLTKGVDYEVADTDADNLHDGIRFLNAQNDGDSIDVTYDLGDVPDVTVNQTQTLTFEDQTEKYNIDDAMVDDGIQKVEGTLSGNPHTFTEGVDFEEWDSDGNGRPEGIDWSIGGSTPDDDTQFTVTYDAGTQFLVDYDITEGDITIDADEKFTSGDVTATEV